MERAEYPAAQLAAWHRELLRYGHRLTAEPDLAEDLAQEALLRLLRVEDARRPDNPRAWLFRVVTNLVRDRGREQERRRRSPLPVDGEEPVTPARDLERSETVAQVRAVLEKLSSRDREMLILRESGFRHREIAEILGVQPRSVSVLLSRAVDRFRTAYLMEAPQ